MIRFHAINDPDLDVGPESPVLAAPGALAATAAGEKTVRTAAREKTKRSKGAKALSDSAQNLLNHIPGEASGFYLLAVGAITEPTVQQLVVIFVLAVVLLLAARSAAGATRSVIATTLGAFVIWMFVLDKGLFAVAFPNLLPVPMSLIVAVFYSSLITVLASAGKIK